MPLWFLAVAAVNILTGRYFLDLMKLSEAIFQIYMAIILYLFILSRSMMYNLVDLLVIVLFNERWVPFDCEMHFLKEVIY